VSLHELEDFLSHAELPTDDYDILGGLVMDIAGHIPVVEESMDYESLTFVVEEMDGTRIKRVRVIERASTDDLMRRPEV